jgi:hypothetical protein
MKNPIRPEGAAQTPKLELYVVSRTPPYAALSERAVFQFRFPRAVFSFPFGEIGSDENAFEQNL